MSRVVAAPRQRYFVNLTWYEVAFAARVGLDRHISSLRDGRSPRKPYDDDFWTADLEGAVGECAFARFLNIYWSGSVDTFGNVPDVGSYQIRTRSKPSYELFIRPHETLDAVYILVRGRTPKFELVGWQWGHRIREHNFVPEWCMKNGGPPLYVMPDRFLEDMSTLPRARITHG